MQERHECGFVIDVACLMSVYFASVMIVNLCRAGLVGSQKCVIELSLECNRLRDVLELSVSPALSFRRSSARQLRPEARGVKQCGFNVIGN